ALYALDAENGELLWKYITRGDVASPLVDGDTLYFGSLDRRLYAFRLESVEGGR
ncbi:MAG: PQQ-binding-like beta-propeller repeat protein, partial [Chloroflexi bacterium]|nr:PQQ-binding-like beta-propeller repeat protein [Chloroflexota bacterium]